MVRDMGTATYVRIGDMDAQNDTLTGAYQYTEYDAPPQGFIDASRFFVVSDTADAVVEVTGVVL